MKIKLLLLAIIILMPIASLLLPGCDNPGGYGYAPAMVPKPSPATGPTAVAKPAPTIAKPTPKPVVAESECGPYIVSQIFPCEDCAVLRMDRIMPKEVHLDTPFEYTIKVTNLTATTVEEVEVAEKLPANFKLSSTSSNPKTEGGKLVWALGKLAPNASREIKVAGSAITTGCLEYCSAVTYAVPTCAYVQVVQPKLSLVKSAPAEVIICDEIPLSFTVTNTGSGNATNVKITDILPEGLITTDGKKAFAIDVGTLEPGKPRTFVVKTKAQDTGSFTNKATATADAGLKAESNSTTTVVTRPVLTIEKTGPKNLYLGRSAKYTITITNTGDASAVDTVIEDTIPADVTDVRVLQGGKKVGSKTVWELGTLAPKASKTVAVAYTPTKAGVVGNRATAKAYCTDAVSATAQTSVKGIPALLLEVIDIDDPIEVGSNETYRITITNQGSATATNITVKTILEDTMQYVSSAGATTGALAGDTVTFKPLPTLASKAKASWTVVVKAVKEGDVRFKVIMNSDQLGRDVEETESTNFYE